MQPLYYYTVPYRGQKNYKEMSLWLRSHMKGIDEIKEDSKKVLTGANKYGSAMHSSSRIINTNIQSINDKINTLYKKILIERS